MTAEDWFKRPFANWALTSDQDLVIWVQEDWKWHTAGARIRQEAVYVYTPRVFYSIRYPVCDFHAFHVSRWSRISILYSSGPQQTWYIIAIITLAKTSTLVCKHSCASWFVFSVVSLIIKGIRSLTFNIERDNGTGRANSGSRGKDMCEYK